jgi:hypothetical protein
MRTPLFGRVQGLLFAARYDTASTIVYNELGFGILARAQGRIGFFPLRLWVDSEDSRRGGLELWGLVKEIAAFDWQVTDKRMDVSVSGALGSLVSMGADRKPAGFGLPLWFPCMSSRSCGGIARWSVRSRSVLSRPATAVEIPTSSLLSTYGMRIRSRGWALDPLDLAVFVPQEPM